MVSRSRRLGFLFSILFWSFVWLSLPAAASLIGSMSLSEWDTHGNVYSSPGKYFTYDINTADSMIYFGTFSSSDVGSVHVVSSGEDFDIFVSFMTNGKNDAVYYQTRWYWGYFYDLSAGVDFKGFEIESLALRLDSASYCPAEPWDPGYGDWFLRYTLLVYGSPVTAPEPTSVFALSACGLGMLIAKRRRRKA